MNDQLTNLLAIVKSEYHSADTYNLHASFYPYKNISHTIRIHNRTIFVRISDKLYDAPEDILRSIIIILLDKLFRKTTFPVIKKSYANYINKHVIPHLQPIKRKVSSSYKTAGIHYNLDELFEKVNNDYFSSSVKKPSLGWSMNRSTRRLGFYDHERDLLVISKIFDHRRVPDYVVEYIMYHEMLHIVHPVARVKGRRIVHSKTFKKQEILFEEYTSATRWLNKKLWRLKILF